MKKVIGIPGYKSQNDSFGAGINHLEFISKFGNARIIMAWEDLVKVDMLYLPGGLDISPINYGQHPTFATSNQDVFKEYFFREKLNLYIAADIPIFGVCLGAQMLAVRFGGKLTQDLLFHEQSKDRWETAHKVRATKVIQDAKYRTFEVNSHHHQALTVSGLNGNIIPLFTTTNNDSVADITDDGDIIEAFTIAGKPIVGVQWHPEELYDVFSMNVIKRLLNNKTPLI